jgi:hypothetical protein
MKACLENREWGVVSRDKEFLSFVVSEYSCCLSRESKKYSVDALLD